MEIKSQERLFNLSLQADNLLKIGLVESVKDGMALIKFSDDCSLWLKTLTMKSGLSFPLEKDETVLIVCPFSGDLTEGYVWGSLPDNHYGQGFRVLSKDGFSFSNGTDEILKLIVEALKTIASSKTTTLMGPQVSLENAAKLPMLVSKLEAMTCS